MKVRGTHTDIEVMANRPDMTIINKNEDACVMIDVAKPAGRNISLNGSRNEIELQEFIYRDETNYNMKCMIISVIIGATGRVTKGLNKRFEAIPGKRSIGLLQKNNTHNRESLKPEG